MDEKTKELVHTILLKAIDGIRTTKDFVIEQLPEVIQQLLYWKMFESGFGLFLGVVILTLGCVFANKTLKNYEPCSSEPPAPLVFVMIMVIPLFVSFVIWDVWDIMNMFKIWLAPKLFLLEYATNLVK